MSPNSKRKILVIDGSDVVLGVVRGALEAAGHEVITHNRAAACLPLFLREKPDLVLLDSSMPGLGDTVVGMFGKTSDTIVLFHSSASLETLRQKAHAAGANGFIQKTGDLFALVREINRWLARGSSRSSAQIQAAQDMSDPPPLSLEPAVYSSGTVQVARLGEPPSGVPRSNREAPTSAVVATGNRPRVLLVDDEITTLSAFRRVLQSDAFETEFALSGLEALRRVTAPDPPRVVVCDVLIPDLTGAELYARAIAHDPSYRERFVVVTGAASVGLVRDFLKDFPGPVLRKPPNPEQLRLLIERCLNQSAALRPAAARGS